MKAALPNDGDESRSLESLGKELGSMTQGTGIYLVGMMGSGKSTVASEVARAMGYVKLDSDDLVERAAGRSIPDIFKEEGEEAFREAEAQVLEELSAYKGAVISTGGGAPTRKMNWMHLQTGIVVFLDVHPDILAERILADGASARPMLETQRPDETEEECAPG